MPASSLLPSAPPKVRAGSGKVGRRVFIGLPTITVVGGTSFDVSVPVLEEFRLNRLVLSVKAQALLISNIRVGTRPLNVSSNPISGNAFSHDAINNELSGYVATPGTGITLSGSNPETAGTGDAKLAGGFHGWAAL